MLVYVGPFSLVGEHINCEVSLSTTFFSSFQQRWIFCKDWVKGYRLSIPGSQWWWWVGHRDTACLLTFLGPDMKAMICLISNYCLSIIFLGSRGISNICYICTYIKYIHTTWFEGGVTSLLELELPYNPVDWSDCHNIWWGREHLLKLMLLDGWLVGLS